MFTRCFPLSSLLQDAWFQRDHRTNQRPIPVHRRPVSHFRWRLKGKSTLGASVLDQGASVAPAAPGASVLPLRGSWTVTHTKHRAHRKCLCPLIYCLVRTVVGKALKASSASLVCSRLCVSGVCVLGLASLEKI